MRFLSHKPYKDVTVKNHVFEIEFFFVFVLVDERSFEFSLLSEIESFHLDLFCKIDAVL